MGSKTINFSTGGYNGFTQSDELGTCSGTSNQIVFSNIDPSTLFVKGDTIYITSTNDCKRIMSVSSLNIVLESNLSNDFVNSTFKRGGIAPNTHYYVYATSYGYLCTTRSQYNDDSIVDFPQGSIYKQLPCVITTNNSGIIKNCINNGLSTTFASNLSMISVTSTTYTSYSLSLLVPKNANMVTIRVRLFSGTNNNDVYISSNQTDYVNIGPTPTGLLNCQTLQVSMDSNQRFFAKLLSTSNGSWADITILGFSFCNL